MRLDKVIAQTYSISRSFAVKLIKQGSVSLNTTVVVDPSKHILQSEVAHVLIPKEALETEKAIDYIIPEHIDFDIVYEDTHVLVINKRAGMSVHTSDSERTGTVLNGLVERYKSLIEEEGPADPAKQERRPGIVHRLDKETSGILITAKDRKTQEFLSNQFKVREVYKEYHAIIEGKIDEEVVINKPIARNKKDRKKMGIDENGRVSLTTIIPQKQYFLNSEHLFTLIHAIPKTGRTHQIRVHLKSIGRPIVGDTIYNGYHNNRMLLHAYCLRIRIPGVALSDIPLEKEFIVNPPVYFDEFIATLNPMVYS